MARQARLDDLVTESRGAATGDYELCSTLELVELMNREDAGVPAAVGAASPELADAIDAIAARLAGGGRLVYVGAGSSGRLAELDASECEATFGTKPGQVVALVAGAERETALEREAAEDDAAAGEADTHALGVGASDAVVGVSASGRTSYVLGALRAAAEAGALTVALTAVSGSELAEIAGHEVAVVVGPEFLAGSTRLKAGTAHKLVLNAISTISMIRLGKTFGNLMVDVRPANEKLRSRVRRIVREATGADEDEADAALAAARGEARTAIVSLLAGVDAEAARALLADAGGSVRRALG